MSARVRRSLIAVSCVAMALLAWVTLIEPRMLVTNRNELALPRWPSELAGLRVALLSDLHVGSPHWGLERLPELVARTNAERPDIVILAGDYVTSRSARKKAPPDAIAAELSRLSAPLGVFAVLGNHDVWFDANDIASAFERHGVKVLENQVEMVRFRGAPFYLVGLADIMTRPQRVAATLDLIPAGATAIAFVHEPDVFVDIDERVAITLAGHTHGGQVNLPLLGRLVVPSDYGARFAVGHVVEEGRHLFVTSGVGTSIMPVRFRVPPEIAILTLR